MFNKLNTICQKPNPFEFFTTSLLWDDDYISKKMLEAHLDQTNDIASRNKKFFDKSIDWIIKRFNLSKNFKVCDFGCGPGLYTTEFAKAGAEVTGIDFARLSIEHARKTAESEKQKISYILKNYLEFNTDSKFDLIIMTQHDFCALSPDQRSTLLTKFHNFLNSDGHILLDVYSREFFRNTKEENSFEKSSSGNFWSNFWSEKPYYAFNNTFKYEHEKLLLNKHTIIEQDRIRTVYNWLQTYSLKALTKEFKQSKLEVVEYYSDITGANYEKDSIEIAVVAQKT